MLPWNGSVLIALLDYFQMQQLPRGGRVVGGFPRSDPISTLVLFECELRIDTDQNQSSAGNSQKPIPEDSFFQKTSAIPRCAGVFIGKQYILSAKHCFWSKGKKFSPDSKCTAYWGGTNVTNLESVDLGWSRSKVESVTFTPNANDQVRFDVDMDIAVVKIEQSGNEHEELPDKNYVNRTTNQSLLYEIVGWGRTEGLLGPVHTKPVSDPSQPDWLDELLNGRTEGSCQGSPVLMSANVSLSSSCPMYTSKREFCAGGNGTDTCAGDSGGPIFAYTDKRAHPCGHCFSWWQIVVRRPWSIHQCITTGAIGSRTTQNLAPVRKV